MRSLNLKLTLAFVFVSLVGMVLAGIFIQRLTRTEFDRFLVQQQAADLVDQLAESYRQTGNWQGCEVILQQYASRVGQTGSGPSQGVGQGQGMGGNNQPGGARRSQLLLADVDGVIVCGPAVSIGRVATRLDLRRAVAVQLDNRVIGYLLGRGINPATAPLSPAITFVERFNRVILFSALIAGAIALLLGIALARNITRPVRELNEATQVISKGRLGVQVAVRSNDEIGELAASFNRMSTDLARSNQLRKQMTADIAHDLRTPLSLILGYTEALSDGKLQGSPEMYAVMHQEANHLNRLIDDLRLISLADAGELPLNRVAAAPVALIESAAMAFRPQAEDRQIELSVACQANLPQVNVDPERMAQVLGNLISNALRYTPRGGQIGLSASIAGSAVLLQVSDSGPGIAPENLENIFNRFFRGEKSRPVNGESGLGLTIAKALIEAHDGTLSVESTVGQGTVFTIRLPAIHPS